MTLETKTVSELQGLSFPLLSLTEKINVLKRGRPLPDIKISKEGKSHNKKYIRSFNSEWYERKKWLCGCEIKNALFCFPCLLLGGEMVWTQHGFTNIGKMKELEKHEKSMRHIDTSISLSLLGTVNVLVPLGKTSKLSVHEHNKKVTRNREILSKLIDCIKFSGSLQISLRNTNDSANPDVLKRIINFASKLDPDLRNHLETNVVFQNFSITMQDEILDCMLQVYHEQIQEEIQNTPFVAIMIDDTSDISEHIQMIIVLRYVRNKEVVERFWGFFTPDDHTADGISKCILDQLEIVLKGNKEKLIAQTFDGASIMKGKNGELQKKIKSVYENAHFIHCHKPTHQLNLIIKNAASITRSSRIFFSNLSAIAAFFSFSPLRWSILDKHVINNTKCLSPVEWNFRFQIHTVNTVYDNFVALGNCIDEIQRTSIETATIAEATGILHVLNDDNFRYWLELFYQIMPHLEVIYSIMRDPNVNVLKIHEYLANFNKVISELRRSKYCDNANDTLKTDAMKICDCVSADITERFSFINHLQAANFLKKNHHGYFRKTLTKEEVHCATIAYPMIAKMSLTAELHVFYDRKDLHIYSKLTDLLSFIINHDLGDVLSETVKLVKLLLTTPMPTSESERLERCFSTLSKIKTFLKSTSNQKGLSALGMISVENKLINSTPDINVKVMELFARRKFKRMDFTYQ